MGEQGDRVGQQVGNYLLLRYLDKGSFAEVYLGEHRYLELPVAIKLLHVRMQPEAHATFQREARVIAHVQHPHIVQVRDYGIEEQTPYLVMEYLPNGTLRTRHPRGTRLFLEQIIFRQASSPCGPMRTCSPEQIATSRSRPISIMRS